MGFSVQNCETGELDYVHCESNIIRRQQYDEETGEPFSETVRIRYTKFNQFKIPKEYLRGTMCEEFEKVMMDEYEENDHNRRCKLNQQIQVKFITKESKQTKEKQVAKKNENYSKDAYMNMEGVKNEILLGYNKNTFRIFLIPSLFCFNIYVALLTSILELFLHYWSHRRNGLNMNKKFYYRSPLHVLTSQFCATCRAESEVDIKIFDTLNKQMRLERKALRDVTKVIT